MKIDTTLLEKQLYDLIDVRDRLAPKEVNKKQVLSLDGIEEMLSEILRTIHQNNTKDIVLSCM